MKNISLKLDETVFDETERIVTTLKKSRNRYINEALSYYNKYQKRLILEKKLKRESNLIKADSLNVLEEFESIDYAN